VTRSSAACPHERTVLLVEPLDTHVHISSSSYLPVPCRLGCATGQRSARTLAPQGAHLVTSLPQTCHLEEFRHGHIWSRILQSTRRRPSACVTPRVWAPAHAQTLPAKVSVFLGMGTKCSLNAFHLSSFLHLEIHFVDSIPGRS